MKIDEKIKSAKKFIDWLESKGCIITTHSDGVLTTYDCIKYVDGNPYDSIFYAVMRSDEANPNVEIIEQIISRKIMSDYIDRLGIQHSDSWEEFMLKFSILET